MDTTPARVVVSLGRVADAPRFDAKGVPLTVPDRLEVLGWVRKRRFGATHKLLRRYHALAQAEPARELWSLEAFGAFAVADPTLTHSLEEWARRHRRDWSAQLALGLHRFAQAEVEGDTDLRRDLVRRAESGAARALEAEPSLVAAHVLRLRVDADRGRLPDSHVTAALAACPASLAVREAVLLARTSLGEGLVAGDVVDEGLSDSRYRVLLGMGDWAAGRGALATQHPQQALEAFDRALRHGEHWRFRDGRARALEALDRVVDARRDSERALAARPQDTALLRRAAWLAARARGPAAGEVYLKRAEALDPRHPATAALRRSIAELPVEQETAVESLAVPDPSAGVATTGG
ncbi:MAG: hypothetical protein MJE66_22715 [Proteobacteria bacterium]|nr:hypothetical protein [Pseudomonadota bacterium]